jgi:hypothetical protein
LLELLRAPNRSAFGFALGVMRRLIRRFRVQLHKQCDRHFADCRVVSEQLDRHIIYIGIAALARKPETP